MSLYLMFLRFLPFEMLSVPKCRILGWLVLASPARPSDPHSPKGAWLVGCPATPGTWGARGLLPSGTLLFGFFEGCSPAPSIGFSKLEGVCKDSLGSTLSFLLTTCREHRQSNLFFWLTLLSTFVISLFPFSGRCWWIWGLEKMAIFCLFHQVWGGI